LRRSAYGGSLQHGGKELLFFSRETWDAILHNWPTTLYIPGILIVLGLLMLITRMSDNKEKR
jgi:hypothetical protein